MTYSRCRAVCALVALLPLLACVSKESYRQKADEAIILADRVRTLDEQLAARQRQIELLGNEKIDLNRQCGDIRQQLVDREDDLNRARADIARLESVLSARDAETGRTLSEMRQTVELLREENRVLGERLRLQEREPPRTNEKSPAH